MDKLVQKAIRFLVLLALIILVVSLVVGLFKEHTGR